MEYQGVEYDLKFKVLIIGSSGVGKTSLLKNLVGDMSQSSLLPTCGIDFVKKGFEVDGAKILLEVWDTAGQERFRSITKFHYRGTKGVVLMYDVTNSNTLDSLNYWIESIDRDLDKNNKEPVPVFIVGNKIDLTEKRTVSTDDGQHVADNNLAYGFLETSAKDNINVSEVFSRLAYAMVEINDPSMLDGYKYVFLKKEENSSDVIATPGDDLKRKKKKRRDYTRSTVVESFKLSHEQSKNGKHKCVCNKG